MLPPQHLEQGHCTTAPGLERALWQVGQYTRFAGVEGEQEGNAHFCGEHTSIDAQGYLEGAVETGERAAVEIISDLR